MTETASSAPPPALATSRIIRRTIWLLLVGLSAPGIAANAYLIRRRRSAGDVVIARRNVVEDHLDHIAGPTGLLMIDVGDILGDCRLLDWRQSF
jgi:hypothetical protein